MKSAGIEKEQLRGYLNKLNVFKSFLTLFKFSSEGNTRKSSDYEG